MSALYNEIDPKAGAWLRELIKADLIAPGDVTTDSIEDIKPNDLSKYTQFHTFAGIGVWSYALRKAGWPDDRPVWTGSCPCQPFSAAGKRGGTADERHLWPAWEHLIAQCSPQVVFGEQVASKDGLGWLDVVQTDLEGQGYAVGANDLCAAGVGAPHIRQRLYFVAERMGDNLSEGLQGRLSGWQDKERQDIDGHSGRDSATSRLADAEHHDGRPNQQGWQSQERTAGVGNSEVDAGLPGPTNGFWRDVDWLGCRDGKWRPVESGTFPLVDGAPARVGRLRGYGNAINPEVARIFIKSYMETGK